MLLNGIFIQDEFYLLIQGVVMKVFQRKSLSLNRVSAAVFSLFVIAAGTAHAVDMANPVSKTELAVATGGVSSTPTCSIGTVYRYASRIDSAGNPHAEYVCLPQTSLPTPISLVSNTSSSSQRSANTSADLGGGLGNFNALLAAFPSYSDPCGNNAKGGWHLATFGEAVAIASVLPTILADVRGRTGNDLYNAYLSKSSYAYRFDDTGWQTSTTYQQYNPNTSASSFHLLTPYLGYGYPIFAAYVAYVGYEFVAINNSAGNGYFCTQEV